MLAYITTLVYAFATISLFINKNFIAKIINIYTYIVLSVVSLLSIGEVGIYPEWRTKINSKALVYLKNPSEVFESISFLNLLALFFVLVSVMFIAIYVYKKFVEFPEGHNFSKWYSKLVFILLTPLILFYFVRGGTKEIPISQSDAWYSDHMIMNDAAVNTTWNFVFNYIKYSSFSGENPFIYFDAEFAQQRVEEMHQVETDTTINILNSAKPNIVYIILESWPATVIESISGDDFITPNFHKLEKEGVLFTNLYASGNRSQQGMVAFFAGFPSLPITTFTNYPEKYSSLPSMVKDLNENGWNSSFYFGGQLRYGNIKSYLMYNQFDKIIELENFDKSIPRGRLGVHDEYLFQRSLNDLKNEKEPFFHVVFTQSSHSPYDQPLQNVIKKDISELPFINSVYYTDKCLGDFFENAKKQHWYKNTLFVIVADHSHVSHKNYGVNTFEYRQIPMLIMGDVIKEEFKGTQYDKIASQTDITTTILKQLGLDTSKYRWSKNLFNPYTPEFAYFEMNEGFAWLNPQGQFLYHLGLDRVFRNDFDDSQKHYVDDAKAYVQELFQEFLDY
jgi:phosphoglycerol transferase MdoB-like AlkP superfamily enzyme